MAKVDKSLYTKQQWRIIREQRRQEKQNEKLNIQSTPIVVEHKSPKGKIAFVLGNGTSRKGIDLNRLKEIGTVYACNAVYREFDPDYLVAVDVKMILEINKSGYQHKNPNVWTNPNKTYHNMRNLNFFQPSKGWSSGPTALWLASQHNYEEIYILGFDFKGLDDGKRLNNIFADTPNYKKSTDSATFFGNWMRQTKSVIDTHKKINFYRVIQPDNYQPEELNKFSNFKNILIKDFHKILENF